MAHIGTCQLVPWLLMYIHAAWSHVHQCWVKLFTILTKLRKEGDQWIHAHQSRSDAYTSGRVPRSLFKSPWLCWMYQLSSMQCVLVCWWWSSTSDWLRFTACPVYNTYSAKADVWMSPLFSTRRCSLTCCLRLLPVWPMYTLEHSTQGMEYTTPLHSSTGTGSFRHISIWRRVRRGQNTTLTPRGFRTRLPWTPDVG